MSSSDVSPLYNYGPDKSGPVILLPTVPQELLGMHTVILDSNASPTLSVPPRPVPGLLTSRAARVAQDRVSPLCDLWIYLSSTSNPETMTIGWA
jgi:hypothetical protein